MLDKPYFLLFTFWLSTMLVFGQKAGPVSTEAAGELWHGLERSIRYAPEGEDFDDAVTLARQCSRNKVPVRRRLPVWHSLRKVSPPG